MTSLLSRRYLSLAINIVGSLLGRSVNVLATVITVPIALHNLGTTDYAAYAAVVSFALFFGFSDLGIGLSVVNPVAAAQTPNGIAAARLAISQAWGIQLAAGVIVAVGCSLAALAVGLLAPEFLAPKLVNVLIVAFLSVGIGLVTGLAQRVLFALQRNFEANAWILLQRLLSVAATFVAAEFGAGLAGYVVALQLVPAVVSIVPAAVLFGVRRRDLAPRLSEFQWPLAQKQLATGILFSILNLVVYCEMGLDVFILGLISSPDQVALYDVTSKPFFYIASLSGILIFPLWPFIAREMSEGRMPSRKTVNLLSGLLVLGLGAIAGTTFAFIDPIVYAWVKIRTPIDPVASLFLALNGIVFGLGALQSMILNAHGEIRLQAVVQVVFVSALLPLKFGLGYVYGPAGIAGALTLAYLPRLLYAHIVLMKLTDRPAAERGSDIVHPSSRADSGDEAVGRAGVSAKPKIGV